MANIPVAGDFSVEFPAVEPGDRVIYTSENEKLSRLLSNDKYLRTAISSLPQLAFFKLFIPAQDWEAPGSGEYAYFRDVENEMLKETHRIEIALDMESLNTAAECGLSAELEVLDGRLRFRADSVPQAALTGECMIISESGDFTSTNAATNADVEDMLDEIMGLFES